jgi:hypothetical protein
MSQVPLAERNADFLSHYNVVDISILALAAQRNDMAPLRISQTNNAGEKLRRRFAAGFPKGSFVKHNKTDG